MKITRVIKNTETGEYEAQLALTEEQCAFLIQTALGILAQRGTIEFFDISEDEFKSKSAAAGQDQEAGEFLESLNKDDLPQA